MAILAERVGRVIDRFYAAAEGSEPWTTPLDELRALVRGRMASVLERRGGDGPDEVREFVGVDPSHQASYERYYWTKNIYMQRLAAIQRPGLALPHEMYLTDREILRSEYYQDYLRHLGIFRVIAGMITRRDGRPVRITVSRSQNDQPFSREDANVVELLLPHFQRAIAIHERLTALPPIDSNEPPDGQREYAATTHPLSSRLRQRLGLTPAEATVANRLAAGQSVAEICGALSIRETTARTHLRHLFQKTQTRRQAELVAWLLRDENSQRQARRFL